ncbi:MAG TPA: hypothetical protein VGG00_02655, partial [Rhodanobacter sp.]
LLSNSALQSTSRRPFVRGMCKQNSALSGSCGEHPEGLHARRRTDSFERIRLGQDDPAAATSVIALAGSI